MTASRCSTAADPNLGKPCSNPDGEAGKCGFVAEQAISEHTNSPPPGTSVSLNFSKDKAQSCLYVGDNSNMTIYILNRSNLQELGRLGRRAAMPASSTGCTRSAWTAKGNIYTAEVDTGKRIQKFIHYGGGARTACTAASRRITRGRRPSLPCQKPDVNLSQA